MLIAIYSNCCSWSLNTSVFFQIKRNLIIEQLQAQNTNPCQTNLESNEICLEIQLHHLYIIISAIDQELSERNRK